MKSAITPREFLQRRKQLMNLMNADTVAILFAAPETIRSADTHYPYRQNSNFYYLTGFPETHAVAVFIPGRDEGEFVLFNQERDPTLELWTGRKVGQVDARLEYGVNEAYSINELETILPQLLVGRRAIYYEIGREEAFDIRMLACLNQMRAKSRAGMVIPQEFINIDTLLHEMRLIKSPAEIELMRQAARISAQAHCRAMQVCRPGLYEYALEAELLHEFYRHGARAVAYNSIVGGGKNACVLHYQDNADLLCDGDLVLIDAGAEYHCYAADITRTFPVNGKFTPAQRQLYEIVLSAQLAGIQQIKPNVPWDQVQKAIVQVITQGLLNLGILQGDLEQLLAAEAYRKFYMHRSGHWLGIDVHDVGSYTAGKEPRLFQPGMVLTVEPGIYIPEQEGVAEKWWNIGIRIEDDVVVTADGYEVLSADVPKEPEAIEALMPRHRAESSSFTR